MTVSFGWDCPYFVLAAVLSSAVSRNGVRNPLNTLVRLQQPHNLHNLLFINVSYILLVWIYQQIYQQNLSDRYISAFSTRGKDRVFWYRSHLPDLRIANGLAVVNHR